MFFEGEISSETFGTGKVLEIICNYFFVRTLRNQSHYVEGLLIFQTIMFEYLVAYFPHKKIVSVEVKENLQDRIREIFRVPTSAELLIQSWNEKYEDFVDVDDVNSLPDSGKLSVR